MTPPGAFSAPTRRLTEMVTFLLEGVYPLEVLCVEIADTCSSSCKNNGDCLGGDHCRSADDGQSKECTLVPLVDDVGCGGTLASVCNTTIFRRGEDPILIGGIVGLSALVLLWRRRRRRGA